jgi:hypothetical protein
VKSATGSFSAGILLVAALVFIGGLAVFLACHASRRHKQAHDNALRIDFDRHKGINMSKLQLSIAVGNYD